MKTGRPWPLIALTLTGAALASCTTQRYVAYEFRPRPLTIDIEGPLDAGIVARAVVSVLGIVEDTHSEPPVPTVHVRMHLENLVGAPISLDETRWLLLSADVAEFGLARLAEPAPGELGPQGMATVDVYFPVAPGRSLEQYDLSNLNLRFGVNFGDATILISATFERWIQDPYAPYYVGPNYCNGTTTGVQTTVGMGVSF